MFAIGRFLAVCTVVAALAVATPVLGWCPTAEHRGQSLHPLFEHVHHVGPDADEPVDHASHAGHGSSWSVTTAFGAAGWMAGVQALLPPTPPPNVALDAVVHVVIAVNRPFEYLTSPLFPPPRAAR